MRLAAPVQLDWAVDGVLCGCAVGGVESGLLEREVPFGGFVGVIDEHEAWIVAQAVGLLDHSDLILANESRAKEPGDWRDKGGVVKDVPRSDHVDAAGCAGNGRDGGERGEPLFAAANDLSAAIGQREVDGCFDGLAVDAEQLVRRGVAAGRVGAHAKTFGNGLEALGLLSDTGAAAPPPGLVDKGSVGRVHEADDAVIYVAGQVG